MREFDFDNETPVYSRPASKLVRFVRTCLPPHWMNLSLIGITLLFTISMYFENGFLGGGDIRGVCRIRDMMLICCSLAYGIYSVIYLNPLASNEYRIWLCSTPWESNKRPPFGWLFFNRRDLVVVGLLMALASYRGMPFWYPAAIYLVVWLVGSAFLLWDTKAKLLSYVILFAVSSIPMLMDFNKFAWLPVFGLLPVVFGGNRLALKHLRDLEPSNSKLSRRFPEQNLLGWPYGSLYPMLPSTALSSFDKIAISLILGFGYVSVFGWFERNLGLPVSSLVFMVALFSFFMLLTRLGVYLQGTAPPISFWGRVRTGKLIVKGYDIVFVIPLIGAVINVALLWLAGKDRIDSLLACGAMLSSSLLLSMTGYPSLFKWRLTGEFRHNFSAYKNKQKDFVNLGSGQPTDNRFGS